MTIRSITPQHLGPFSTATKIEIERDVTVLTGPNDAGKSYALAALKMFCQRTKAAESHVNTDRIGHHAGSWNSDSELTIAGEIEVTDESIQDKSFRGDLKSGDLISCRYLLNQPEQGHLITGIQRGSTALGTSGITIKKLPKIVEIRSDISIKNVIDLAKPSPEEDRLLKLGFGPQFVPATIQSLNPHMRGIQLDKARDALNARLKQFFPQGMQFEFRLTDIAGEGKLIGISLVDGVQGFSPVEYRGTGIKRLLALMGLILQEVNPAENTVVLLDEPENSLHADAQHQLRRALEALGKNPRVQVVYATHSPAMINPAHPERIRVFSRQQNSSKATTKVTKPTYGENFQQVRISLGLTPADSLLYGLVTILVEGDTEVRCLAPLLRKLSEAKADGFDGITSLLESCHFVCCRGESISYFCKLSADQNARPIVFLDGDKRSGYVERLGHERPTVPIIQLPAGKEFENIVPQARYIAALAECLQPFGADVAQITSEAFDVWNLQSGLPEQMMFSKRIDRWVEALTGGSYNKHVVMETAIGKTPVDEMRTDTLRQLAGTIKAQFA